MNNEPVAWMCQDNVTDEWEFSSMKHCHKCEPLYTHPANPYKVITDTKIEPTVVSYTHPAELTDEEIMALYWRAGWDSDEDVINFARAILRKAQEK